MIRSNSALDVFELLSRLRSTLVSERKDLSDLMNSSLRIYELS